MQVLFVHGMGRSPASAWWLLRRLRHAGLRTATFGYHVSRGSFAQVAAGLTTRVESLLAENEPLVLVGHSLGGVLLRQALGQLGDADGRVHRLFLLGSPVHPSSVAGRLAGNALFRLATRDCGQLLASAERMSAVPIPRVPTTAIVGTQGPVHERGPFGLASNDGIVSLAEVSAPWIEDRVLVPVLHTLLPSSGHVGRVILDRLGVDRR